jgi:hypothetical protein
VAIVGSAHGARIVSKQAGISQKTHALALFVIGRGFGCSVLGFAQCGFLVPLSLFLFAPRALPSLVQLDLFRSLA